MSSVPRYTLTVRERPSSRTTGRSRAEKISAWLAILPARRWLSRCFAQALAPLCAIGLQHAVCPGVGRWCDFPCHCSPHLSVFRVGQKEIEMDDLVRVQFAVYPTREAAITAGYPDAEWGTWQERPSSTKCVEGWIALDYRDE